MAVINTDINQFPTLTWNHLKINRDHFEGEILSAVEVQPVLKEGILLDHVAFSELGCEGIETGLGREFENGLNDFMHDKKANLFTVAQGAHVSESVIVNLELADGQKSFADIFINAGENSSSTFIFNLSGKPEALGLLGCRIRILAAANTRVHVITVNLLPETAVSFAGVGSIVQDDAAIELTQVDLGSKKHYSGILNVLSGYRASYFGQDAYMVRNEGHLDINQVCRQTGKETVSKFTVDGILMDKASKTWRGTIDFKNGCVEAKGDEQEDVLLLSPAVVNKSLPVILCDEEAVEGRHGCTVGKMDTENLFYMQSRGVDEKTARILLVKAKVIAVSRHIPDADTVEKINAFVDGVFLND